MLVATQFPPNAWTVSFVGGFGLVVGLTYFGSFFLVPLTGNRFYYRYLCPYGATFGLLNHAGFYGVEMDAQRCVDCRRCDQACDMGIPVWEQGKTSGRGPRGLRGLCALRGVLSDRRAGDPGCAQPLLPDGAARRDPAARCPAGGGGAAGRPDRAPCE